MCSTLLCKTTCPLQYHLRASRRRKSILRLAIWTSNIGRNKKQPWNSELATALFTIELIPDSHELPF